MNAVLARQQQELADAIRSNGASAVSAGLLQSTAKGQAARLQIYIDAYRIRLGNALKENYPVLARLIGDESFADLAEAFLRDSPSRQPSIRWFGAALADFVAREPSASPHPSLHDLIRMEWALSIAFDGKEAEPLSVADLLAVPPESWPTLRFAPHPTLQLLALNWNIAPIWTALTADENADTEPPDELSHHLLVWRSRQKMHWRYSAPDEARLLAKCVAGESFASLCEVAAEYTDESAAQTAAGYLRTWVDAGLLVAINPAS
jgi:hypothetical protein